MNGAQKDPAQVRRREAPQAGVCEGDRFGPGRIKDAVDVVRRQALPERNESGRTQRLRTRHIMNNLKDFWHTRRTR